MIHTNFAGAYSTDCTSCSGIHAFKGGVRVRIIREKQHADRREAAAARGVGTQI